MDEQDTITSTDDIDTGEHDAASDDGIVTNTIYYLIDDVGDFAVVADPDDIKSAAEDANLNGGYRVIAIDVSARTPRDAEVKITVPDTDETASAEVSSTGTA